MKLEEIRIGSKIGGYGIEKLLGKGGKEAVYKAHDLSLNRKVALEILSKRLSFDPEFIQRFKREAQIIASLDHPNIVRILAYQEEKGNYYFAMEYINGKDLAQLMKERIEIPLEETLQITAQIASALIEDEAIGVVYWDLKPTNIMIDEKGRLRFTGFGLAHPQETDTKLTRTGWFLGALEFASSEQARGDPLDIRSDIYSLRIILYWMLTGRPPIRGDSSRAVMIKIATRPLPPIRNYKPSVPASISTLIDRMTAKDPKNRFQHPKELLSTIEDCIRNLQKRPVGMESELFLEKKQSRRATPRILGAAIAVVFMIVWLGEAMVFKKRVTAEGKQIPAIAKVEDPHQSSGEKPSLLTALLEGSIKLNYEKRPSEVSMEKTKQTRIPPPLPLEPEKRDVVTKSHPYREIPNVLVIATGAERLVHLFRAHLESIILKSGLRIMSANEFPRLREKIQVGETSIAFYTIKEYLPRDKVDILLLAHIQKAGSTTLQYYGRTQEMVTATFSIQVLDATHGTPVTAPYTHSFQFTAINMEENLKEAVHTAAAGLGEGIKRYWQSKRAALK